MLEVQSPCRTRLESMTSLIKQPRTSELLEEVLGLYLAWRSVAGVVDIG